MKRLRKSAFHKVSSNSSLLHAKQFVFFDKNTGARRFDVSADKNGHIPWDEAASLLAVHCLARDQIPTDFGVMIGVDEELIDGLVVRATKLIESCFVAPGATISVQLTNRQKEVLTGVIRSHTNKEIASKMNVSERTVKFHVSALLEKFHVRRRVELLKQLDKFSIMQAHMPEPHACNGRKQEDGNTPELPRPGVFAPQPIRIARRASG